MHGVRGGRRELQKVWKETKGERSVLEGEGLGGLDRCIVACGHLGNGSGRRTVTFAGFHNKKVSVCVKGCMHGTV